MLDPTVGIRDVKAAVIGLRSHWLTGCMNPALYNLVCTVHI